MLEMISLGKVQWSLQRVLYEEFKKQSELGMKYEVLQGKIRFILNIKLEVL